jgi:hypothetical protein
MSEPQFKAAGRQLMASLVAQDSTLEEAANPMRVVAFRACATADRVAHLGQLSESVDAVIEGRSGPTMHPLFSELRQQESHLARLISALRLPDEATGKRPQRRQLRGVQQPSKVSSLDRARAAKSS